MRTPAQTINVKDRLTEYLTTSKISVYKLERLCGFGNGYLRNVDYNLPHDRLEQILKALPDLNSKWLLTGEGDMTNGMSIFGDLINDSKLTNKIEVVLNRIHILLRMEGSSLSQYERDHKLAAGTVEKHISDNPAAFSTWIDTILMEYPSYSHEWIMTGYGPARKDGIAHIPIINKGHLSDYALYKSIMERYYWRPANNKMSDRIAYDNSDPTYREAIVAAPAIFATYEYISTSDSKLTGADFGLMTSNDSMAPKISRGDIILCQIVETIDGNNSVYVLETKSPDVQVFIGYVEEKNKKDIAIISNVSPVPSVISTDNVALLAKVIGLVRTF